MRHLYTRVHISTSVQSSVRGEKNAKVPLIDKLVRKSWHICTMKYYLALKRRKILQLQEGYKNKKRIGVHYHSQRYLGGYSWLKAQGLLLEVLRAPCGTRNQTWVLELTLSQSEWSLWPQEKGSHTLQGWNFKVIMPSKISQ